jgi:hypothetical protein
MGASWSNVLRDAPGKRPFSVSGASEPAKESGLEAWRHNKLSPPSAMASTRRRISFSKASFGAARKEVSDASSS